MKISIKYGSLAWTSLVSLWARYLDYQNENPLYKDELSNIIIKNLEYDFSEIAKNIDLPKQITIMVRYLNFEKIILNFIKTRPNAIIINLGAGFDTLFYRIDNGSIKWFDIDFSEVLDIKKKLIPSNERYKFISKSILDFSWFKDIGNHEENVLLLAGSLL